MFTNLWFEDAPQVYTLRKRTGGDIINVATELSAQCRYVHRQGEGEVPVELHEELAQQGHVTKDVL